MQSYLDHIWWILYHGVGVLISYLNAPFLTEDRNKVKYLPYIGLPFQRHVTLGRQQLQLMVGRPFRHVLQTRVSPRRFTISILVSDTLRKLEAGRNSEAVIYLLDIRR